MSFVALALGLRVGAAKIPSNPLLKAYHTIPPRSTFRQETKSCSALLDPNPYALNLSFIYDLNVNDIGAKVILNDAGPNGRAGILQLFDNAA